MSFCTQRLDQVMSGSAEKIDFAFHLTPKGRHRGQAGAVKRVAAISKWRDLRFTL
jgi:hypothetical protein